jgi:MEDS: MEthanogen/methylotroph, DcmR Sensory domain
MSDSVDLVSRSDRTGRGTQGTPVPKVFFGWSRVAASRKLNVMEVALRHQCMIYEGPAEQHVSGLATLIRGRLAGNFRCLYLNSPAMVAQMRTHLSVAGVDEASAIKSGALILSSDQDHLVNDRFEVGRMLEMLHDAVSKALEDGYCGLWASGDMAWEFGNERNFAKLLEYEYALEELFEDQPALFGVCQYCAAVLPTEVIHWGLRSHRGIYTGENRSQVNPHYAPAALSADRRAIVSRSQIEALLAGGSKIDGCRAAGLDMNTHYSDRPLVA